MFTIRGRHVVTSHQSAMRRWFCAGVVPFSKYIPPIKSDVQKSKTAVSRANYGVTSTLLIGQKNQFYILLKDFEQVIVTQQWQTTRFEA